MSLSTYSDLQSQIASWLGRDDLTSQIPDFITLFEAYANRTLRARQMEVTTLITMSSGSGDLPSDYLNWRRVTLQSDPTVELAYRHPQYVRGQFPTTDEGDPQVFSIEGSTIIDRPASSTSLQLLYWQKVPSLSSTQGSTDNWLLLAHPDAYLFGSLVEAQAYVVDADRAALWKLRRDAVFDEIQKLSNLSHGGGQIRASGWIV